MTEHTDTPSFDETGGTLSGKPNEGTPNEGKPNVEDRSDDTSIEDGNLSADPDMESSEQVDEDPRRDENKRADTIDGALSPGSTATGDPTSRD